jgi:hypothetical protein
MASAFLGPIPLLVGTGFAMTAATLAIAEHNKYVAYDQGLEWFNNANSSWNEIICGKQWSVTVTTDGTNVTSRSVKRPENDGVVLANSAKGLPCATHPVVRIYPNEDKSEDVNKGSSHMQVRNDEGLRIHLNKLLNGDYDWWFRTPIDN